LHDFFARVAQNLDFTEFAPREMIEQGDTVVVIGTSSARAKRTGKTITDDWVHIFKIQSRKGGVLSGIYRHSGSSSWNVLTAPANLLADEVIE